MNTAIKMEYEELINLQWFGNRKAVFSCLSLMIKDGWAVSNKHSGLVHDDLIAKPIKIHGSKEFTGIGVWKLTYTGN